MRLDGKNRLQAKRAEKKRCEELRRGVSAAPPASGGQYQQAKAKHGAPCCGLGHGAQLHAIDLRCVHCSRIAARAGGHIDQLRAGRGGESSSDVLACGSASRRHTIIVGDW